MGIILLTFLLGFCVNLFPCSNNVLSVVLYSVHLFRNLIGGMVSVLSTPFFGPDLISEIGGFLSGQRLHENVSYHFAGWNLLDSYRAICYEFSSAVILNISVAIRTVVSVSRIGVDNRICCRVLVLDQG